MWNLWVVGGFIVTYFLIVGLFAHSMISIDRQIKNRFRKIRGSGLPPIGGETVTIFNIATEKRKEETPCIG
jgi:hypothetical protein